MAAKRASVKGNEHVTPRIAAPPLSSSNSVKYISLPFSTQLYNLINRRTRSDSYTTSVTYFYPVLYLV